MKTAIGKCGDGRIILKWISEKWLVRLWVELV
jgi:hypothetical protein